MDGRLLPCGERAVLIEVADLDAVMALRTVLAALAGRGAFAAVRDVVAAATTVLLGVDDPDALPGVREAVVNLLPGPDPATVTAARGEPVEIGVHYDGADLAEVARLTGLRPDEVVAAHTGRDWVVAFGGFAPGFAYLAGGDERLQVPRRAEPRTRVPPGAVGLAGPFSGIYPRASPGGWQLIGRTDIGLWDAERDPPALLQPGGRVRFRSIDEGLDKLDQRTPDPVTTPLGPPPDDRASAPLGPPPLALVDTTPGRSGELDKPVQAGPQQVDTPHALTVLATGPLALVVDEGRPGYAAVGVSPSGAADRSAYRLANRLVGNPPGAAALEIVLGGLAVRAASHCLATLTGADCAPRVDGRPVTHAGAVYLRPGQVLRLGVSAAGLRCYLAVAGGFEVPLVLGSASTDTLSGVGPPRIRPGDRLSVGPARPCFPGVDSAPRSPHPDVEATLDVLPGPRAEWIADTSALTGQTWRVSERSDRVGVRLLGEPLRRHPDVVEGELPSEPTVRGSIQVPPDGQPVIFGADHPVTGGYPVIGVLTESASDTLAQARPGDRVRFRWASPPTHPPTR
ncbi:MAG: urea amidolyase family protein [Micropruina sp.]